MCTKSLVWNGPYCLSLHHHLKLILEKNYIPFKRFKMFISSKYAHILLFQFVFTKYVFGFRNYDGLTFVVIYKIVIRRDYDKFHTWQVPI